MKKSLQQRRGGGKGKGPTRGGSEKKLHGEAADKTVPPQARSKRNPEQKGGEKKKRGIGRRARLRGNWGGVKMFLGFGTSRVPQGGIRRGGMEESGVNKKGGREDWEVARRGAQSSRS